MTVYHISDKVFEAGNPVLIRDFGATTLYHQNLSLENKAIDVFLSAGRPEGEPERQLCIYAFSRPEHCLGFMDEKIQRGDVLHLYRCEMDVTCGHPMFLIRPLQSIRDEAQKEAIRKEYWTPTKDWKVIEFMSEKMMVVEEIPITKEMCTRARGITKNDYADDAALVCRLYK